MVWDRGTPYITAGFGRAGMVSGFVSPSGLFPCRTTTSTVGGSVCSWGGRQTFDLTGRRRPGSKIHQARTPERAASMAAENGEGGKPPARVLMVCLGNICRSPAAEAVFRARVAARDDVAMDVDSCGTGGGSSTWYRDGGFSYHEGDGADSRMQRVASARGYKLTSRSRPLRPEDFAEFDVIVGMDASNLESIDIARRHWGVGEPGAEGVAKVALLSTFSSDESFRGRAVPDPYYGGEFGFEHALDLIEGACDGLIDAVASDSV